MDHSSALSGARAITASELFERLRHAEPWTEQAPLLDGARPRDATPECSPALDPPLSPRSPAERTDAGTHAAVAAAETAAASAGAANPKVPVPPFRTDDAAPVLVLDTRPAHLFRGCPIALSSGNLTGHVRGAVNIQVPTLMLRRSNRLLREMPEMLDEFDLRAIVPSPIGQQRLAQLMGAAQRRAEAVYGVSPVAHALVDTLWFTDVVVLWEAHGRTPHASQAPAHTLLQVIAARRARAASIATSLGAGPAGGLYYVDGGLRALRAEADSPSFFALSEEPAPGVPVAHASSEPQSPVRSLSLKLPPRLGRPSLPRLNTLMDDDGAPERRHSANDVPIPRMSLSARLHVPLPADDSLLSVNEAFETLGFEVSTIVPGELYLGSDITSASDVEHLRRLGVRAVLNTAAEIEDGGAPHLALRAHFDEYLRVPMRDIVEAAGVQQCLADACAFLGRMHRQSRPTYVHCRAGKSRSATIVIAYLIQSRRWTLQHAYAFVAARRERTSPNIGFIAELMHFERDTLGTPPRSTPCAHAPAPARADVRSPG